jgi:hypothetical protein
MIVPPPPKRASYLDSVSREHQHNVKPLVPMGRYCATTARQSSSKIFKGFEAVKRINTAVYVFCSDKF